MCGTIWAARSLIGRWTTSFRDDECWVPRIIANNSICICHVSRLEFYLNVYLFDINYDYTRMFTTWGILFAFRCNGKTNRTHIFGEPTAIEIAFVVWVCQNRIDTPSKFYQTALIMNVEINLFDAFHITYVVNNVTFTGRHWRVCSRFNEHFIFCITYLL